MVDSTEKAKLNLLGQTLQLIWKSSPVKIFLLFLVIVSVTCLAFTFRIDPIYPFIFFSLCIASVCVYLFILLPKRPELFQDCSTWLGYQRLMIGDKKTGLKEIPTNLQLYQPVVQSKTTFAKANIKVGEVIKK